MKPAALTTTCFLGLVAGLHILRVVFQLPIVVGETEFPMAASVVGGILIGALAVWLRLEQKS